MNSVEQDMEDAATDLKSVVSMGSIDGINRERPRQAISDTLKRIQHRTA